MPRETELTEREQLILKAVVHTYITSAEAVGSRSIVKRLELDLSPATVRNVMADLEEAGYLRQLHTSSGRVPTDRGYRYYVDYLMGVQELTLAERTRIEQEFSAKLNDADEVMRQTSHLLALISRHTGIVEAPDEAKAVVRRLELIRLSPTRAALMVADSYGRVRTMTVSLPEEMTDITKLNQFLNDVLQGASVEGLAASVRTRTHHAIDQYRTMVDQAMSVMDGLPEHWPGRVYLDGTTQLFEQPEFRDIGRAREVFGLLEERDRVVKLLRGSATESSHAIKPLRASVVIGSESNTQGFEEISVVAAPYQVAGRTVGRIGVLGPRRMPYSRLTAVVDYTAGMLGRFLTRLAG